MIYATRGVSVAHNDSKKRGELDADRNRRVTDSYGSLFSLEISDCFDELSE